MSALSIECLAEHELIESTRDGDDRAFEELYSRYQGRIGAFIHSRVRDHGRAEDVAQEVFISALRRLRAGSQEIAFKPWIYEIAKNACIDEYRRSLRGREVPLDDEGEGQPGSRLQSTAPSPPAAIETKERLSDLRGAFGVLSENHHQLIVLREFEGLSYDEIGARTGMSRQMVESALFRARRKLTEEYEELASGRRCVQIQSAIEAGRAMSASSLGLRERRRFARHLAHCQPCRMHAQLAGVDGSLLITRTGVAAKIAALLPFPLLRWPWAGRRAARAALSGVGAHPEAMASLQRAAEPAAATSMGGAAVAAAVLALAGTGAVVAPAASRGHAASAHGAAAAVISRTPTARRSSAPTHVVAPVPAAVQTAPAGASTAHLSGHAAALTSAPSPTPSRPTPVAPRTPTPPARSGAGPTSGGGIVLPRPVSGAPSAGTVVGSAGGSAAGTIRAVTRLLGEATAPAPLTKTISSFGNTLAVSTQSVTATVAPVIDSATAAVSGAATSTVGSSASGATSAVSGVTGTVGSVLRGLTGH